MDACSVVLNDGTFIQVNGWKSSIYYTEVNNIMLIMEKNIYKST